MKVLLLRLAPLLLAFTACSAAGGSADRVIVGEEGAAGANSAGSGQAGAPVLDPGHGALEPLSVHVEDPGHIAVELVTVACPDNCVTVEAVASGGFEPYVY